MLAASRPAPQGYGNGALALLFTVASNALGIVTAPIFVKLVLGGEVAVDAVSLLIKLSVSILLPLVVGKAAREVFPAVAKIAKIWKLPLGMLNSFQIMMIVWQTLSYSQKVRGRGGAAVRLLTHATSSAAPALALGTQCARMRTTPARWNKAAAGPRYQQHALTRTPRRHGSRR